MSSGTPGAADPAQRVEVSLMLRPRRPLEELESRLDKPLSREEFAANYGADPADIEQVSAFARKHGLEIVEVSQPRRTVQVAGRASDVARLFGIEFQNRRADDGTIYRAPDRPAQLPSELEGIVRDVFGLDGRPIAQHHD